MLVFEDRTDRGLLAEEPPKRIHDGKRRVATPESLRKTVIEAARVYAIDLAREVPLSTIFFCIATANVGTRGGCAKASSVSSDPELGSGRRTSAAKFLQLKNMLAKVIKGASKMAKDPLTY